MGRAPARQLAARLGPRDRNILASLQEYRIMTGGQLRRLHFPGEQMRTQAAKSRRVLGRLSELGVITQLPRRVGGINAGSDGLMYGLSGLGQAVLRLDTDVAAHHWRSLASTKAAYQAHRLAVSELAVSLLERAREGVCLITELRAEPGCWRWFSGLGGERRTLKPDLYVRLELDGFELAAFCEIDLDSESLPTIKRKLGVYLDYWHSGIEQRMHGLFPRVWWLVPSSGRVRAISSTLRRLPEDARNLFAVGLLDRANNLLTQLSSLEGGAQ